MEEKSMFKTVTISIVLALVILFAALGGAAQVGAAAGGEVNVTLTVDQPSFVAGQPVTVHVTIANPGDKPVKVLKWYTPVDEVEDALFALVRDGQPVQYVGAIYKRPAPKHEDYINLKAGESVTRDVDLAQYYDLSVSGDYTVAYDVASWNLYSEKEVGSNKRVEVLTSNEVTVWIDGRAAQSALTTVPLAAVTGTTTFNRCTTSQQSAALGARTQASTYSADALAYLNANKQGARYTTWFGTYNSSRYNTITSHFASIGGAMDTAPVKFDCSCKKKYYAYVYPTQPYTIYLCSVFWTAPLTGTDSKAGTLIHEMSHFNVVASTDDYVYGQAGAKNLAISNPSQAIDNADNHEYFAENTPALP